MVLFETGRLIHRPALPSRLITQGRFPFPTSSPSISHFSPSSVSNFSPPLRSLPLPHPTFLSPAASPAPHPTPPPGPPPPSNRGSPSTFHFIVSPGTDFSLSPDHFLAGYSCIFCPPFSFALSLSSGQTVEGGSPWAATNYSFPSIPSPCCQKRLQKRQIRRLKNTFCFLLSRCSNFITSQQILGRTY